MIIKMKVIIKCSDYIFNHVNSLEYHFHKVSLNRGSSYMPQPEWISHKKSSLNPDNHSDNWCFFYAIVIPLNYHNIDNNPQRISNLLPFIAKYQFSYRTYRLFYIWKGQYGYCVKYTICTMQHAGNKTMLHIKTIKLEIHMQTS